MCTRPIQIKSNRRLDHYRMIANNAVGRYDPSPYDILTVPCGHCPECVKERQNHHAFRLYKRIEDSSCVYHMTLTYRPSALPFACVQQFKDFDSGEIYPVTSPELVKDEFILRFLRESYSHFQKSNKPLISSSVSDLLGDEFEFAYTPSLDRSHVRSMIKCCRIQFERDHGFKMPEFTYSFCGEYGPTRCRPHYHLVIASRSNLSEVVAYFDRFWQKKYGFTVIRKVEKVSQYGDKKVDGYLSVARYLSKYVSKGVFECDSVKLGYAQKGRVCQSRHLDNIDGALLDEYRSQHLCFDIFGRYNPVTFRFLDGSKMSSAQLDIIVDNIIKRNYVFLGKCPISMPRKIKEKIFYVTDKFCKPRRLPISYLVTYRVQQLLSEKEDRRVSSARSSPDFLALSYRLELSKKVREERINENYKAFLSRQVSNQ